MLLFIQRVVSIPAEHFHSNTSHVIVYLSLWKVRHRSGRIQIHLMLLFIALRAPYTASHEDSNTSHVIVYPERAHRRFTPSNIQIHLMLLFIEFLGAKDNPQKHSNTSHVIVYQLSWSYSRPYSNIQIHLMLLFIGSRGAAGWCCIAIQIHLMLLFILLFLTRASTYSHSNTSHVIVYRRHTPPACAPSGIQIHLMLLFIGVLAVVVVAVGQFKYISCYCLSRADRPSLPRRHKFKYISCYCLSARRWRLSGSSEIQIHLMLLFIALLKASICFSLDSNTSHVIVYPWPLSAK